MATLASAEPECDRPHGRPQEPCSSRHARRPYCYPKITAFEPGQKLALFRGPQASFRRVCSRWAWIARHQAARLYVRGLRLPSAASGPPNRQSTAIFRPWATNRHACDTRDLAVVMSTGRPEPGCTSGQRAAYAIRVKHNPLHSVTGKMRTITKAGKSPTPPKHDITIKPKLTDRRVS